MVAPTKKKLIILYSGIATLFLTLALCGYYLSDNAGFGKRPAPIPNGFVTDMTYFDLPRIMLAVGGQGKDSTNIRLDLSLEVAKRDLPMLEGYQPKISERLNRFLIGMDPDEIKRSKAVVGLRHDLLDQVNSTGMPIPVHDLFLRQLVVM